jgi:hypothetical protein
LSIGEVESWEQEEVDEWWAYFEWKRELEEAVMKKAKAEAERERKLGG